jgi:hypothetical protein
MNSRQKHCKHSRITIIIEQTFEGRYNPKTDSIDMNDNPISTERTMTECDICDLDLSDKAT